MYTFLLGIAILILLIVWILNVPAFGALPSGERLQKIQALPSFNKATRRIQRLLIGHATDVEVDNSGRVLLPTLLREYGNLEKEIVLIGQGNKFEIWDKKYWQKHRDAWLAEEADDATDVPPELQSLAL